MYAETDVRFDKLFSQVDYVVVQCTWHGLPKGKQLWYLTEKDNNLPFEFYLIRLKVARVCKYKTSV